MQRLNGERYSLSMPVYVFYIRVTDKGKASMVEVRGKMDEIATFIRTNGGQLKLSLATFGEVDYMKIVDLPSDELAMKFSMLGSSNGLLSIETVKAFVEDEMGSFI